ncbi:MAG: guanylate kinase [Bacteroidia bacterium]
MEKLVIFSAPSGSGKTTVVQHLLNEMKDELGFSVSATTRKKRPNETEGKDYYFLEEDVFRQKLDEGKFLEFEEVYNGLYYGTLFTEVKRVWEQGKAIVFDVDVKGGLNIKKQFGNKALAVFLRPPSLEILMERLRKRDTEVEHHLQERIDKANYELEFEKEFDIVIINDDLNVTLSEAERIVKQFLLKS